MLYLYQNIKRECKELLKSKNIRNRVLATVLREKLLKQLDNGAFEPKKLKREKVKEVLLSYRTNLQKVSRECIKNTNFS